MQYILKTEIISNHDGSKLGVSQRRLFTPATDGFYDRIDDLIRNRSVETSAAVCERIQSADEECWLCVECIAELLNLEISDVEDLMFLGLLQDDEAIMAEELLELLNGKLEVVSAD